MTEALLLVSWCCSIQYGRLEILAKFPVDRGSRIPEWKAGKIVAFGLRAKNLDCYGQQEKTAKIKILLRCCCGGGSHINPTLFCWLRPAGGGGRGTLAKITQLHVLSTELKSGMPR